MNAAVVTTAIACGLMAGVYFAFSGFVMTSLAALPRPQGIAAMQSINKVIVSSSFMPLFFGSTIASLALAVWGAARWGEAGSLPLLVGGLVYVVGMFVCTAVFNVPLNESLDAVDPGGVPAVESWSRYLRDWTRWNHLRTACSVLASGLFVVAAQAMR